MEFTELQTQTFCIMTQRLMIINYTKSYVKHFRLTIYRKWTLQSCKLKVRLERKINVTLPALLPNKMKVNSRGPVTSSEKMSKTTHISEARELYHF